MYSKRRIVLAVSFIIVLAWDLFLKISADLSFMGGVNNYSYVGDSRVPGSLLIFVWILQVVIMYMGSIAILQLDIKKIIPNKNKNNFKDKKYECNNCHERFPEYGSSININKEEIIKFCPHCGVDQKTQKITIKSVEPITYDIRSV